MLAHSRLTLDEPGVRVLRAVGDYAAVVSVDGKRAVTVSSLPVTARDNAGRKTRASLELESRAGSYAPKAALVPLRISKRLSGGFVLSDSIHVTPVTARDATARRIGQTAFFGNTDTDTDVLIQATPRGAEVFWQLRSDRSAEQHSLRFALPDAAVLRVSSTMTGAAEVVAGGVAQLTIPPPIAHDADGRDVPVTMSVAGGQLTVTAHHKGHGWHYPILVDPPLNGVVRENYGDFYNPANGGQVGFPNFIQNNRAPFGFTKSSVLQVFGSVGVANNFGLFSIQAPGSAQIFRVDVDNAYQLNPAPKPAYFYANVLPSAPGAVTAWTFNAYNSASLGPLPMLTALPFGPVSLVFCAGHNSGQTDSVVGGYCSSTAGTASNYFQFGIYTASNWPAGSGNYLAQIGGASVSFADPAAPTEVTLAGVPAGWVQNAPSNVTVSAKQGGLGLDNLSVADSNGVPLRPAQGLNCYYDFSSGPTKTGPTTTTLPPCPSSATSSPVDLSLATLPEGVTPIRGNAQSITGVNAQSSEAHLKIDRTAPDFTLDGSLYARAGASLFDPQYTLSVNADDTASGVARIELLIDEVVVKTVDQTCPALSDACSLQAAWTLVRPQDLPHGVRRVGVRVTDRVGKEASTSFLVHSEPPEAALPPDERQAMALQQVIGAAAGDDLGRGVSPIGDINGDSISDYAIGAPGADPAGRANAGSVYVMYGRPEQPSLQVIDLATFDSSQGFRIDGAAAGDRAGISISVAGDVNGDDLDDLVVGSPGPDDLISGLLTRGAAHVVFGSEAPGNVDLANIGQRGFRIVGPTVNTGVLTGLLGRPGRKFGFAVSGGPANGASVGSASEGESGDFNGDGLADIVVGASQTSSGLLALGSGSAYIVFGKADTTEVSVDALAGRGVTIQGSVASALAGYSVLNAGDTSGDGLAEIVVGVPGSTASGPGTGEAQVLLGTTAAAPQVALATVGASGYRVTGAPNDELGLSLAALGDVDKDTRDDFAAAGRAVAVAYGKHAAPGGIVSASDSTKVLRVNGFGADLQVRPAGDYNYDTMPDLLIGASSDVAGRGSAWLIYGDTRPLTLSLTNLGGERGLKYLGGSPGDRFGSELTGVGPAVGANASEQMIAAPSASPQARTGAGVAYILPGVIGEQCADTVSLTAADVGGTMTCVEGQPTAAIDRNNDGVPEEIRPAPRTEELASVAGVRAASSDPRRTLRTRRDRARGDTEAEGRFADGGRDTWFVQHTGIAFDIRAVNGVPRAFPISNTKLNHKIHLSGMTVRHSGEMRPRTGVPVQPGVTSKCANTRGPACPQGGPIAMEPVFVEAARFYGPRSRGFVFGPGQRRPAEFRNHRGFGGRYIWDIIWFARVRKPDGTIGSVRWNASASEGFKPFVSFIYRCQSGTDGQCRYTPGQ